MKILRILKYVLKEIFNNKRFCLLFVLNLSMGLTGMIALEGFKSSIDQTLAAKSRDLLGADFGLSARRPLSDLERGLVREESATKNIQETKVVEVFSMVKASGGRSRLVKIRAVDSSQYPFYGEIKTSPSVKSIKGLNAWVHPELLGQLEIELGENLKIGAATFNLQSVVVGDAASGFSNSVAPRVYINIDSLEITNLVTRGSIAWYSSFYKIPELSEKGLEDLEDSVFKKIDSPEVRVFSHKKASRQITALVGRLNDFLGLTSLVAFFLAAIGTFFLTRSYFASKTRQVAILMSLGLSPTKSFLYYLSQVFTLGLISAVLAGALSFLIVPVLGTLLKGLLPFEIDFFISLETFVSGLVLGSLGSVLISFPLLMQFLEAKPLMLLSQVSEYKKENSIAFKKWVLSLPALFLFVFMSVELSNSYLVGLSFSLGFGLVLTALSAVSILIFRDYRFGSLSLKWALRDLHRNKTATSISFVSIGIGVLLLNLIPQVQKTIEADLTAPERSNLPTFFMFDVQEEQVVSLKNIVKTQGAELKNLSPSVRARLMSVNGKGFSKSLDIDKNVKMSREQEREQRFRNRGFNLSYRNKLDGSEKIIEGEPFSGIYDEDSNSLPEVSIETRFAKRLGLKISDILEFEIDGVPFEGKIVNRRSVKWSSFQPNFFIQFQPGALDLAPKTFVSAVKVAAPSAKLNLQNAIVDELPNISMVDVTRVVERLMSVMIQMGWALNFMSLLCILVGFAVIYSVASHQADSHKWDIGLLKSLGAPFSIIRGQFLWQFFMISLSACTVGVVISFAASYFISVFFFETTWQVYALVPLLSYFGVLLMTLIVTYFAIRKTLSTKTVDLFL